MEIQCLFNLIKTKAIQFGLGILCLGFTLFMQAGHLTYFHSILNRVDGLIYDFMVNWNLHKKEQATRVIIIDIDNSSVQTIGRWPWPRDKFVTLLSVLKNAGVVVVAFDIVMSEAEINYAIGLKKRLLESSDHFNQNMTQMIPFLDDIAPKVDNDEAFANALANNDVALGYLFHHDASIKKGVLPQPLLNKNGKPINASTFTFPKFQGYNGTLGLFEKAAPKEGFVSNIPDIDGVIRHGLLLANYENNVYTSLTLSTVMHYLLTNNVTILSSPVDGKQVPTGLKVGGIFVPLNSKGEILIPFFGLAGTIDTYSASDIMQNKVPAEALAGSIAIIGSTMVLLADLHETPVLQNFPGVELVANMVSAIISQQITREHNWNTLQGFAEISTLGIIYSVLLPFLGPVLLLIVYSLSVLSILLGSLLLFSWKNTYVACAIIFFLISSQAVINFVYNFILERRQKNKIRQLFGQYVPPSYVKEITDFPERYTLDGELREMTVFFADIRGFTSLSESLDATEVKRLLNTFFTPLTDIIFTHQGTIDKYVGDMIMAFWGAPLPDKEHSHHALCAALDINSRRDEINNQLEEAKLPRVKIGMGLSTGPMNVGDMGSSFRRAYTVIGDTVNLASRLQDLTKFYQVDILVSESTRINQDLFFWCPVDKVAVKGRLNAVNIYTPLGYSKEADTERKKQMQDYEQALASYYNQDWATAKSQFDKLISLNTTNYLYQMYRTRIEEFIINPPNKDWDGTFVHTHK